MFKNKKTSQIIMIIAAALTIIGVVTGKFFFLFLILPLGFLFNRGKD
ncbi:hypothetical protein [Sinomicrobium pectinilyticum]|nr:hypothetical protein [Sinomicrobium pectinilyticum]